jgi:DNA-binding CsgD family transcriptional regulator
MFSDVRVAASLATHEQSAERTKAVRETAAVLAGAMEALSLTAFICDGTGTVLASTPTAEALIRADRGVCLISSRLCAVDPGESLALEQAIAVAARARTESRAPAHGTVIVGAAASEQRRRLVLEVIPLPRREHEARHAPCVLVIARGTRPPRERRAAVVQAAYALTRAEAQIAVRLSAGERPEVIAAARRVAVGTVRTQIKSICAKLGVGRQAELVARLNDL